MIHKLLTMQLDTSTEGKAVIRNGVAKGEHDQERHLTANMPSLADHQEKKHAAPAVASSLTPHDVPVISDVALQAGKTSLQHKTYHHQIYQLHKFRIIMCYPVRARPGHVETWMIIWFVEGPLRYWSRRQWARHQSYRLRTLHSTKRAVSLCS